MKRITLLSFFLICCTTLAYSQLQPFQNTAMWNTKFLDDFNTFNSNRWYKCNYATHGNPSNNAEEPQVYMNDNVNISNGNLVLRTQKLSTPITINNHPNCMYNNQHMYTSGQIVSTATHDYGYYEIYAKLPSSPGYWPAFWFWDMSNSQSNPWYNELDVFEGDGNITNYLSCGIAYDFTYPVGDTLSGTADYSECNYNNEYHWYGVEWDKHHIIWYIDRVMVRFEDNIFDGYGIQHPMYIILNVALFPNGWSNAPISTNTIFPNYMYIDKFNAYVLNSQDTNVVINDIYNFSTYNYAVKKSITLTHGTTIPQNGIICLYAKDYILLKDGFEVPLGSCFEADVRDGWR
jgi:beta-glucanase (GH16 family)